MACIFPCILNCSVVFSAFSYRWLNLAICVSHFSILNDRERREASCSKSMLCAYSCLRFSGFKTAKLFITPLNPCNLSALAWETAILCSNVAILSLCFSIFASCLGIETFWILSIFLWLRSIIKFTTEESTPPDSPFSISFVACKRSAFADNFSMRASFFSIFPCRESILSLNDSILSSWLWWIEFKIGNNDSFWTGACLFSSEVLTLPSECVILLLDLELMDVFSRGDCSPAEWSISSALSISFRTPCIV